MQQLFAGQVGVQNEALQIAAWGAGPDYGIQVSRDVDGFQLPIIALDASRITFPIRVEHAAATLSGDRVVLTLTGSDPEPAVKVVASLDGNAARVEFRAVGDVPADDWHIVVNAARGNPWVPLELGRADVELHQSLGQQAVRSVLSVTAEGSESTSLIRSYGPDAPLDLDAQGSSAVVMHVEASDTSPMHRISTFDERKILRDRQIRQVVVWLNSGLRARFGGSCYARIAEGSTLMVFTVKSACLRDG